MVVLLPLGRAQHRAEPAARPQVKSRSILGTLVRWTLTAASVVATVFAILVGVAIYDDIEAGRPAAQPMAAAPATQAPTVAPSNQAFHGLGPYQPATYQGYPPPVNPPPPYGQR